MRSILDPLPRFLTTRGLVLVVGMLLLGTAISVHEYLESARPPARSSAESTARLGGEAVAPAPPVGITETRRTRRVLVVPEQRVEGSSSSTPAIESEPGTGTAAPSLWEPVELHPGR